MKAPKRQTALQRKEIEGVAFADARKILTALTPTAVQMKIYHRRVARYVAARDQVLADKKAMRSSLRSLSLEPSLLFGFEYLVAYVDDTWFSAKASMCDAAATDKMRDRGLSSPPLVIVPLKKMKSIRSPSFRPILEHEFVHVNQAILGLFPPAPKGDSKQLLKCLTHHMKSEYEANYIQNSKWPVKLPPEISVSHDEWCVLRGYTQALETILRAGALEKISEAELILFLKGLPKALPRAFRSAGVHESHASRFVDDYARVTETALTIITHEFSQNRYKIPLQEVWAWFDRSYPKKSDAPNWTTDLDTFDDEP